MSSKGLVQELGDPWESTKETVEAEVTRTEREKKKQRRMVMDQNAREYEQREDLQKDFDNYNMKEISAILNKAKLKDVFPFAPVFNENREIVGFKPKGKSVKEVKENIMEYKVKMQEALDTGKIDQEEFNKLEENLDELMKENNIELDEENEKVRDEEINDYVNAIIYRQFGDADKYLPGLEEQYLDANIKEKENFLNKFNREVNLKMGTTFKWSHEKGDIPFENSFNKDGKSYTLSTEFINIDRSQATEPSGENLKNILYAMVERSLTMKKELHKTMTQEQLKQMHEKLMKDKQERQEQEQKEQDIRDRKTAEVKKQYMRTKWNG